MRFRLFVAPGLLAFGVFAALLAHGSLRGQSPTNPVPKKLPPELRLPPAGPAGKGVVPASGITAPPAGGARVESPRRKAAPIDRFRNYDKLPELTREIVFATQRGMEWLSRDGIHLPSGRFVPGLNPALGRATSGDSFIYQATAALALSRSARLTGDEKYAVHAAQAILSLLSETPRDQANPGMRTPAQPDVVCNRVGAAAYLALAIFELPNAAPELKQCGEELCQYLRTRIKDDGSVQCSEGGTNATTRIYAGPALAALAASNRNAAAAWKQQALARGCAYYRQQWKSKQQPAMAPWLIAAYADMHLQTKQKDYADFVLEMGDQIAKLQYEGGDRQHAEWRGGFPPIVDGKLVTSDPTADTAFFALALAEACRMIRSMDHPDAARYDRYRAVLTRTLQFLTTLQYGEDNTVHFAAHFRPYLVGAFHSSLTDGNLRVDQTAIAVCALTQFLIAGADR